MKVTPIRLQIFLFSLICIYGFSGYAQNLESFKCVEKIHPGNSAIQKSIQFNGYTNYWQNSYNTWIRYGNLFKMAAPDVQPTILQSKINIAEDMGLPGLLVQEGFVSQLFEKQYARLENPSESQLENELKRGNVLVILNPESELGKMLDKKSKNIFEWATHMKSHQLDAVDLEKVKAFYLVDGERFLFVVSSASSELSNRFFEIVEKTRDIIHKYELRKGWFGASTLLNSVTCTPGHPLEIIGEGMNEGNSWFIFDGYMDFWAKDELESWVDEVKLPIVANVGFSPIYGCSDYDGLQVQDMQTKQAWIDFAHKKGGYVFRPVYDPSSDAFQFDGYIAQEGNKEQIDNENVPFISKTGSLIGNLTSSMVLFVDKGKALTNETIWEAIMNRQEVSVLEEAKMMGPARYRNALELLFLDKDYLEKYFGDRIDLQAKFDGYNLIVTAHNYSSYEITGNFDLVVPNLKINGNANSLFTLAPNVQEQFIFEVHPEKEAMGKTNPVAVHFKWGKNTKSTLTMLDLPPAVSMNKVMYANKSKFEFPVTVHNFSDKESVPVELEVYKEGGAGKPVFSQIMNCETPTGTFSDLAFTIKLDTGNYVVKAGALGLTYEGQIGIGKAYGKPHLYEMDLNSDGMNEYRMENDSVQVTLLRIGARVIQYIVKSRNDNVLFKAWPDKTYNDRRPYRKRGYYPYGGFEDFLGQASMETHKIYDAKIIQDKGDFVRVEMEADFYGNKLKKIFTLYGNSPLLEIRFELTFKNPEANMIGPQPILELGKTHGTEDIFTVPTTGGLKEYRMRPEQYYGQAFNVKEGWNAGCDSKEKVSFVGAFPVTQPLFLHMWMNHPDNGDAPHYYVEFQPWTPIIQKTTMYFSYYIWGSGAPWQNNLDELRKRNLITTR